MKRIIEDYYTYWMKMSGYTKHILFASIILLWVAGMLTAIGIPQGYVEENILLNFTFKAYGVWTIIIYDAIISLIFILIYKMTERMKRFKNPFFTFIHVMMMLAIFLTIFWDFLNNFTLLYAYWLWRILFR